MITKEDLDCPLRYDEKLKQVEDSVYASSLSANNFVQSNSELIDHSKVRTAVTGVSGATEEVIEYLNK